MFLIDFLNNFQKGGSMNNLIEIQNQIEKLQSKANEIKAREFGSAVSDILAKMQAFGISIKDLRSGKLPKGVKGRAVSHSDAAASQKNQVEKYWLSKASCSQISWTKWRNLERAGSRLPSGWLPCLLMGRPKWIL